MYVYDPILINTPATGIFQQAGFLPAGFSEGNPNAPTKTYPTVPKREDIVSEHKICENTSLDQRIALVQ